MLEADWSARDDDSAVRVTETTAHTNWATLSITRTKAPVVIE